MTFSPAELCFHISPVDLESVIKNSIVFVNFRAMNVILNCVSLSPPKANTKQKQHAHVTNKYCQSASKCDFSIFQKFSPKINNKYQFQHVFSPLIRVIKSTIQILMALAACISNVCSEGTK